MEWIHKISKTYFSKFHYQSGKLISLAIIFLCILVTIIPWPMEKPTRDFFGHNLTLFLNGEYWRPYVSLFMHADMAHLLSNAFFFYLISYFTINYFGLGFMAAHFLILGPATAIIVTMINDGIFLIGLSGVIYALWGSWFVLYIFLSVEERLTMRITKMIGVGLILLFPSKFEPNTSYLAHSVGWFLGAGFGFIFYFWNRLKMRKFVEYTATLDVAPVWWDEQDQETTVTY